MKVLNLAYLKQVSGGESIIIDDVVYEENGTKRVFEDGSVAYGSLYLKPDGHICFNTHCVIKPDGKVFCFGYVPEGWKKLELVLH